MSHTSWPQKQLRHLSEIPIINGLGASGDSGNPLEWPRYVRTTDIESLFELHEDRRVTLPIEIARGAAIERDDILMTAAGTVGKSFQYCETEPACFAGYLVRWRVDRSVAFPRFMAYWTASHHFWDQIAVGAVKSTIENFSASKYRSMRAPVPRLSEQRAIADFLDRETQQIDELIAEQRGLIETLRERRIAVVSNAIHPFNPVRLKNVIDVNRPLTYGIVQAGVPVAEGMRYIGPSDIVDHEVVDASQLRRTTYEIAESYARSSVQGGDVIVSIGPAYGKTMIVPDELSGANLTQDTARVACDAKSAHPRYVQWALRSREAHQFWESQIMGATFRRLNLALLAVTPVPLPTLAEQREIAALLDAQTTRIDALIAESEGLIALSLERRAALITAAVTGQIRIGADGRQVRVTEAV